MEHVASQIGTLDCGGVPSVVNRRADLAYRAATEWERAGQRGPPPDLRSSRWRRRWRTTLCRRRSHWPAPTLWLSFGGRRSSPNVASTAFFCLADAHPAASHTKASRPSGDTPSTARRMSQQCAGGVERTTSLARRAEPSSFPARIPSVRCHLLLSQPQKAPFPMHKSRSSTQPHGWDQRWSPSCARLTVSTPAATSGHLPADRG